MLPSRDINGDLREHEAAVALRRVERSLEEQDIVEESVLTLATPDEDALTFEGGTPSAIVE